MASQRDDPTDAARASRRVDLPLIAIFAGCAVLGVVMLSKVRQWLMMTDELLYVEMARGFIDSGLPVPQARGEAVSVYQVLYPLLISPIVALFDMPTAYPIIASLNAVLMASVVFPAYKLTQFVTDHRPAALWVAACSGVAPWMAMGSKILTDALAYPMFVWAIYAIVVSVALQSRRSTLWALVAIVAAYLTRSHFIILLPVYCAALVGRALMAAVLAEAATTSARLRALGPATATLLRTRWPVFLAFIVVYGLIVVAPKVILGIYGTTADGTQGSILTPGLIGDTFQHLGILTIGIGPLAIALALPWLLVGCGRVRDARENAGAITFAIASVAMLVTAASFDHRFTFSGEIFERYVFYLVPLLLCATAAAMVRPPKHWAAYAIPILAAVMIIQSEERYGLDIPTVIRFAMAFKPAAIFMIELQKIVDAVGLPSITTLLLLLTVIGSAAAWWLILKDRGAAALHLVMGFTFAFTLACTLYVVPKAVDFQNRPGYLQLVPRGAEKDWVDRAVGDDRVALSESAVNASDGQPILPSFNQPLPWWDVELWNESVRTYYTPREPTLDGTTPTLAPYYKLGLDFESGEIATLPGRDDGWLLASASDPRFAPFSAVPPVEGGPLALYKTGPEPRASWISRGLSTHGLLADDKSATIRVFSARGQSGPATASVSFNVEATPATKDLPSPFEANARERSIGPLGTAAREVCLPPSGHADLKFSGAELAKQADLSIRAATARILTVDVARSAKPC
ncbi:MAG: hypothetical protein WAP35_03400 [Solirubrobacterales bacterium]